MLAAAGGATREGSMPVLRAMRVVVVCFGAVMVFAGPASARSTGAAAVVPSSPGPSLGASLRILPGLHAVENAATNPYASEQLSTYGRPVTTGGVTYWMGIDVFTAGPGSSPDLGVYMLRGGPGHWQLHDYWWLTFRPVSFSVNPKTMTAKMSTGTMTAPSTMAMSFTPTHVYTHACSLVGGGRGIDRIAVGTLSVSTFKVVTDTSPVFGTITVRPRKAKVWDDPGCKSSVGHLNQHPCPRSEELNVPGPAPSEWGAFTNVAGTRAEIDAVSASMTPTRLQHSHLLEETLPLSDLPRPTATATGATAVVLTRGARFATGEGVFTSTHAPRVTTGSCVLRGVTHTYTTSTYTGVFSPGSPRLIALWDTGHIPLVPDTVADLWLSHLTS